MSKYHYGQEVQVNGRNAKITAEAHPDAPEGSIALYEIQFKDTSEIIVCQENQLNLLGVWFWSDDWMIIAEMTTDYIIAVQFRACITERQNHK